MEDVDDVDVDDGGVVLGVEAAGLECQTHQMCAKGRGRRRVRTSRCMAEEERRGRWPRDGGGDASWELGLVRKSVEEVERWCAWREGRVVGVVVVLRLGLRARVRESSVEEREREGMAVSRDGKGVVLRGGRASDVMLGAGCVR